MTWLNLNVTLTEGGKRLEELLQQLKLRQQEREQLDAEVVPVVREELRLPEGSDPRNKRRRIEPIGTRQDDITGGIALGSVRGGAQQVVSADGNVVLGEAVDWIQVFDLFLKDRKNPISPGVRYAELLLPVSSNEFIACHHSWAAVTEWTIEGTDAEGYFVVVLGEDYEEKFACFLVGANNAKEIGLPSAVENYLRQMIPKVIEFTAPTAFPDVFGPSYSVAPSLNPDPAPPARAGGRVFIFNTRPPIVRSPVTRAPNAVAKLWQVASRDPSDFPFPPYDVKTTFAQDYNLETFDDPLPDLPWLINWRRGSPELGDVPAVNGPRLTGPGWGKLVEQLAPSDPDADPLNKSPQRVAVWNWNRTAWCRRQLNRLGFSPSDLTL
jgi:hypothetical protein